MRTSILEKFLQQAVSKEPFHFTENDRIYDFLQNTVGTARVFYARTFDKNEDGKEAICFDFDSEYKPVAIISADNTVYLMSPQYFDIYSGDEQALLAMYENVEFYQTEYENQCRIAADRFFPVFLACVADAEPYSATAVSEEARDILFHKKPKYTVQPPARILSEMDCIRCICGISNMQNLVFQNLTAEINRWIDEKGFAKAVNELIESGDAAEAWELKLAEAISSVSAKTLTVTFELNGNTAAGQIPHSCVLDKLVCDGNFWEFDFTVYKKGEALFSELGADHLDNPLTCRNIKAIYYLGKEIYNKD